ncbi:MAG: RsbRD N-terminal domain-containing protein [Thermodesulfobacteriota bacterium]|nr:RsbRD N-terminal domain-containing protein [Thermodesulfobacteriota bacterium]
MKLENLLSDKRSSIIKEWRDAIIATYPENAQRFLRNDKDRFSNPVGHIFGKDLEDLYDGLIKEWDSERISSCLDNIIRIRAVQDFKPSLAVGFVLQLKKLIKEKLEGKAQNNGLSGELQALEDRIDEMALLAFDIYNQCRQKVYEIRVNQVRNHVGRLLEMANLTCEIPE